VLEELVQVAGEDDQELVGVVDGGEPRLEILLAEEGERHRLPA
jgi:hypothetical protein